MHVLLAFMISLCHILNPVKVNEKHDLFIAQPITFESLRLAKESIRSAQQIEHLALGYPEDAELTPNIFPFRNLPNRSIRNILHSESVPKLPLLADILHTAYQNSQADYFIYSNVDISVQPHFYAFVLEQINAGLDGFIINRRRIPAGHFSPDDLPKLYKIKGKPHPGFDCFVFKRELVPKMKLGEVCIGIPFVETTLAHNLFALCSNFKLFDQEFLTFHLGMEIFKKRNKQLYWHNRKQFFKVVKPALWDLFDIRKFPYYTAGFPMRYVKWGLNPALFTLMNLKLDLRKTKKK